MSTTAMTTEPTTTATAIPKSASLFENSEALVKRSSGESSAMDEYAYRPVTPLAPISLFLGVCSVAGFLGVPALAVGIVGGLAGLLAMWQIRRSEGAVGGTVIARIGLALSIILTLSAGGLHAHTYVTEVPEGHQRITFAWLSRQEPVIQENALLLSPEIAELKDKPIFIKGYMFPSRQREGLKEFVLVKDTGDCCFGKQPKLSDLIVVRMQDGVTAKFREQQLVSVAGVFRIDGMQQSGDVVGLYSLDGTHFR